MEPDRFDDVGYSIVELSDDAGAHRLRRGGAAGIAAAVVALGAVCAAAALALTPGAPPPPAPRPVAPMHFAAETYPVRGHHVTALHGGNCLHLDRHRSLLARPPKL